jgi:hypothetical protein
MLHAKGAAGNCSLCPGWPIYGCYGVGEGAGSSTGVAVGLAVAVGAGIGRAVAVGAGIGRVVAVGLDAGGVRGAGIWDAAVGVGKGISWDVLVGVGELRSGLGNIAQPSMARAKTSAKITAARMFRNRMGFLVRMWYSLIITEWGLANQVSGLCIHYITKPTARGEHSSIWNCGKKDQGAKNGGSAKEACGRKTAAKPVSFAALVFDWRNADLG